MKELTIEEKAKRYDGALERAKTIFKCDKLYNVKDALESVFPELLESEDERIRKAIIDTIKSQKEQQCHIDSTIYDEMITWLEKQNQVKETAIPQHENKTCKENDDSLTSENEKIRKWLIGYFHQYKEDGMEKYSNGLKVESILAWLEKQGNPTNKDEPKFKVGDWVVFNNRRQSIYQVEKIGDGYYILRHTHGGTFSVCVLHDESLRRWTIQDTKDGDILACNEEILLFKSYSVQGRISLYCWYNGQTNNFHSKEVTDTSLTTRNKICPATKKQRDTLMKAMDEAGYEWDAEKKELKKIEQEPSIEGSFVNVDEVREDFIQEVYRVLDADPTNDRANQIISAFDNLPTVTIERQGK